MNVLKGVQNPYIGLLINLSYAVGNCIVGFWTRSGWLITIGAYYAILSTARFCVLNIARKAKGDPDIEFFAGRTTGILLIILSFCLIGINVLSAVKERGTDSHEIVMIAIAAYSFTKITMAIVGMVKSGRCASQIVRTLRNIAFADSVVSIYSLQRSMLVSFPGMNASEIQRFNILTGTAVWVIVLFLGINLAGWACVNRAKERIAKGCRRIAGAVSEGCRRIGRGVVVGSVRLERKLVNAWVLHKHAALEEARERLRKKNKQV